MLTMLKSTIFFCASPDVVQVRQVMDDVFRSGRGAERRQP
jgi:hypothetical protein